MTILAILPIVIIWRTIINFIQFIKELVILLNNFLLHKYIYNDKQHSLEHIEYVSLYILFILSLLLWIYYLHIEWVHLETFLIPLFLMNTASIVLLKHIITERINGTGLTTNN